MKFVILLGFETAVAAVAVANADDLATKVILYGGAATALGILWRTFGRPAARIIRRTADAVEALETLPKWREEHDERLSAVEAELGVAVHDLSLVQNDVSAVRRELGITDDDVRTLPAPRPPRR